MTPADIKAAVEALGIEFIQIDFPVVTRPDGNSIVAGTWNMNSVNDLTSHLRKFDIKTCFFYRLEPYQVLINPVPKLTVTKYKFRGKFV